MAAVSQFLVEIIIPDQEGLTDFRFRDEIGNISKSPPNFLPPSQSIPKTISINLPLPPFTDLHLRTKSVKQIPPQSTPPGFRPGVFQKGEKAKT